MDKEELLKRTFKAVREGLLKQSEKDALLSAMEIYANWKAKTAVDKLKIYLHMEPNDWLISEITEADHPVYTAPLVGKFNINGKVVELNPGDEVHFNNMNPDFTIKDITKPNDFTIIRKF